MNNSIDPTNAGQPVTGYDTPYAQITEWQTGEFIGRQVAGTAIIKVPVSRQLPRRKIYFWLWADAANVNDYWVIGQLVFWNRYAQSGTALPMSIGAASALTSPLQNSLAAVCTSGGSAVADSIGLYVAAPVAATNQPATVVLQPVHLYGAIDQVTFDILSVRNISVTAGQGIRGFMGVLSSQ